MIATDVQVLSDIDNEYKEIYEICRFLFLSDEQLLYRVERFIFERKEKYCSKIIAIGLDQKGKMLYECSENRFKNAIGALECVSFTNQFLRLLERVQHVPYHQWEPKHFQMEYHEIMRQVP